MHNLPINHHLTPTIPTGSECVYLICDNETGLHKIGMTKNWARRSRELQVGSTTTAVRTWDCPDAMKWEKVLHFQFKHKRLPQSEWFRVSENEVLPKMQWLLQRVTYGRNQYNLIIGQWKQAKEGHFYRRRRSQGGHWYTETAGREQVLSQAKTSLEAVVNDSALKAQRIARNESGYWPTKEDPAQLEWAKKDPTLAREKLFYLLFLAGLVGGFAGLLLFNVALVIGGVLAVVIGLRAAK